MDNILKDKHQKSDAIEILQDTQKKFGFISRENLNLISGKIGVPVSELYSIVTFYKSFTLSPRGKYKIRICDGTACHIKGSQNLLSEIKELLGIEPGQTTADGLFSLDTVACMGVCALAPVMVIEENYYGNLDGAGVNKIINEYIRKEQQ